MILFEHHLSFLCILYTSLNLLFTYTVGILQISVFLSLYVSLPSIALWFSLTLTYLHAQSHTHSSPTSLARLQPTHFEAYIFLLIYISIHFTLTEVLVKFNRWHQLLLSYTPPEDKLVFCTVHSLTEEPENPREKCSFTHILSSEALTEDACFLPTVITH